MRVNGKKLTVKEKELHKLEKNLRKKEYDTKHLSRPLTAAKALVASAEENKDLDIRKENDNLKTYLLTSGGTVEGGSGRAPPPPRAKYGDFSIRNEYTNSVTDTSENELLRLKLSVHDTTSISASGMSTVDRNSIIEDTIRGLKITLQALEGENTFW